MLAVSQHGDKVVVNTATVRWLGHILLGHPGGLAPGRPGAADRGTSAYNVPELLGYGIDRAMLTTHRAEFLRRHRLVEPGDRRGDQLRDDAAGEAADLSAWQWAVRPQVGDYTVQGIPPATEPDWPAVEDPRGFEP